MPLLTRFLDVINAERAAALQRTQGERLRVHQTVSRRHGGRWAAIALAWGALGLASQSVHAESCYVGGAFGMNFGVVTSSGRAATSSVSYVCEPDYSRSDHTVYYQLCVYIGSGESSAGQTPRRMSNYNGAYLHYELFSDPAHTLPIGAAGSTPVYQVFLAVPPGAPQSAQAPVHGWVYPGQSVPAVAGFQEQGLPGLLRYRYSTTGFPASPDCGSGGTGGGSASFGSSGVLASFENGCWVVATDLDFGRVDPPLNPVREAASIRIQCAPGTSWKVGLDNGQHFDGAMRRMAGAGGFVRYQLYLDQARTHVWGNDENSLARGTTDSSGNSLSLTVYGEVPPQPAAERGSYADTIIVTLYY